MKNLKVCTGSSVKYVIYAFPVSGIMNYEEVSRYIGRKKDYCSGRQIVDQSTRKVCL